MPGPGTIPDPRMNPNEEKSFGFAFQYEDGHFYVYIKNNSKSPNSIADSRYFTAGTQVELGAITPALLIVAKDGSNLDPEALENIKDCLDKNNLEVKKNWKGNPVIFELIDVKSMINPEQQPVLRDLNERAVKIFNPEEGH